jgi:hypothetical protein
MSESCPDTKSLEATLPQIDTSKRYDVYCAEGWQRLVVYRNVRFKSIQRLLSAQKFDVLADFVELEQVDGKSFFITKQGLTRFCEHGVEPTVEVITVR